MSKLIATSAIRGAHSVVKQARKKVREALAAKGPECAVAFPNTGYFLPISYSMLGLEIKTLGQMGTVLAECERLLPPLPADHHWLPYLGNTLDAGMATLLGFEVIEACKTVIGPDPAEGIWLGAADDVIMRERGVEFVDGSAPGFAAVVGAARDADAAVKLARELQGKNLYVFMAGNVNGVSFAEQLASKGVELGWPTRLVPFGKDISAAIHSLGFASRAALSFGGVKKGDFKRNLAYNKNRVFAFVLALGEVDEEKYAAAAGCINYGFPTIANTAIPQILPTGICTYEHVVSNVPLDSIVSKALEVRGCKVKITTVPIPVNYGPAFEGERIRKEQVQVEFGGNKTTAFEYCTMKEPAEVEDGKITVVGKEADQVPAGTQLPLAIWVEVAGRKMQPDFEPILERQIHHLVNGAEGVWHMGQRDIIWVRISKDAFAKGFRIRHLGEIIRAKFLAEYPAIIDKVQVTLHTDAATVEELIKKARAVYRERNLRLESMTDESADIFYSCLLCQSFAPNHVCVITPERLGLCGAYNWLDGKAAYEIDPTGPNQPLAKGELLDPVRGVWRNINDYVYQHSNKAVEEITMYSIMKNPMTSCGCFEAICGVSPELNGVIVVNREYPGDTPLGMKFSTLAGNVGGGQQTPGFIGCGKSFLLSKKFLAAEGGISRIVWMPSQLKAQMKEDLEIAAKRTQWPDLLDRIADETVGTDTAAIMAFLKARKHPALDMWDITQPGPEAQKVDASRESGKTGPGEPKAEASRPVADKRAPTRKQTHIREPVDIPPVPGPNASVDESLAYLRAVVADLSYKAASGPADPTLQDAVKSLLASAESLQGKSITREKDSSSEEVQAGPDIVLPTKFSHAKEAFSGKVVSVTLGGSGTRTSSLVLGGEGILPFRYAEGAAGAPPAIAMEVFDAPPEKYPTALRDHFGTMLSDPAAMARHCVEKLGAQAISVRLDGCHPDKGNRPAQHAADAVGAVLRAVGVPVIVSGPAHFDKRNEVMKKVAADFAGENLLLNWAETDNYKTIAGAAMGYGHCIVAQSPIDVNMAKQLAILLTTMGMKPEKIVIDPMTGALGYGLEYSYSVMERIRLAALSGDAMLGMPFISTIGFETAKCKEANASGKEFSMWGDASTRGANLEISAAMALINAGTNLLVMYYPEAVKTVKRIIDKMKNK
ncbi:MAG TPA: acetyl-CoA decarbonylase/synthase complex subunit alpha/beta [Chitinivibrionales bacterium]|nr:acetyl-CoA decarbonylase/synthase complex subunit alpha/beta [Chitinivibrionales bacterium]